MENKMLKFFVNAALTFGIVGFITYLLLIISGFFYCCADVHIFVYHKVAVTIVVSGVVTFGLCLIRNCRRNLK